MKSKTFILFSLPFYLLLLSLNFSHSAWANSEDLQDADSIKKAILNDGDPDLLYYSDFQKNLAKISQESQATTETAESVDSEESTSAETTLNLPLSTTVAGKKTMNFGVVKNNHTFQIYRSSILGAIGLRMLKKHLKKNQLPFPKTIIYMNKVGFNPVLPIVGNFALEEYNRQDNYNFRFYHSFDYQNRTYLDGDNPYQPQKNIDNGLYLGKKAEKIFGRLDDEGVDGGIDNFYRILDLVLDPQNQPVLFHCFGGMHRTGMVGLALRYLEGGEWIDGPKTDVYISKYRTTFSLNPAQYEYYLHNKSFFRIENLQFIEEFYETDPKFLELKDKFQQMLQQN